MVNRYKLSLSLSSKSLLSLGAFIFHLLKIVTEDNENELTDTAKLLSEGDNNTNTNYYYCKILILI